MKKLLFFFFFVIIGQSIMNPHVYGMSQEQHEDAYKEQNEQDDEGRERNEQVVIGYAQRAARENQNLYQIIGVDRHATVDQISSAFRRRYQQLHRVNNMEELQRLTSAIDILRNPRARAAYDRDFNR